MIGKFIQQQRKKRNMTQEYIALELGISRPTYLQIERGRRELTVSEARKLAALFDTTLEELLSGKEPERSVSIDEKENHETSEKLRIRVTRKNFDKFRGLSIML
jgi:transcriptional regulator with XRE-family HTH domain